MWEGVDYLFVDEVLMIGCWFLIQIAELPPVGETRLHSWINSSKCTSSSRPSSLQLIMGKLLWLTFNTVNNAFISLLGHLRSGECMPKDFNLQKSCLLCNYSDPAVLSPWKHAPVIVSDNATKDAINEQAACTFAHNTGQELHWYHATDHYRGKPIVDQVVLDRLRELPSGCTAHCLGSIPLVLGMPIIISQNFDIAGGIVNGSIGTLTKIRYTTDSLSSQCHLILCVVHLPDSAACQMPDLDDNEFSVLQDTVKMMFKYLYTGQQLTALRTQVPVQPAFLLTVYKAQGQMFNCIIIDLQGCTGVEAPYMMLSHATSLDSVLVLRPFDEKKNPLLTI
ncbi:hypothetical protein V8D89_012371 [Ganoderma adspersum]